MMFSASPACFVGPQAVLPWSDSLRRPQEERSQYERGSRLLVAVAGLGATIALAAPRGSIATETAPLWIKHIQKYSGGISNGVRQMVSVETQRVGKPSTSSEIGRAHV